MSLRIISSATSDLFTDQRVLKTAYSLHNEGYIITLTGRKLKNSGDLNLPFNAIRFKLLFNTGFLFYASYNLRLFFFLLFSKFDVVLSNDTDTLTACFFASKIRGKKLVFDAHELFPEVPELVNRRFVKYFWTGIENLLFPHLTDAYTVCGSIADYYKEKYGIEMKVVRNVPFLQTDGKPSEKIINPEGKKIILYQGALNTGRGIEWVIKSMPLIENAVFVIIGDGDIKEGLINLTGNLNLTDRVKFIGKIPSNELQNYTASADLGVCLLENRGLSYYYSLPNRIFSFLHAGVPILATNFPEISSIVGKYKTGVLTDSDKPEEIAKAINEIFATPFPLSHFKALAKEFCWENEVKIITGIFRNIETTLNVR